MPSIFGTYLTITSMPNEIQLEILRAAHEAGNDIRPLSQVCRLWREISVKTSTFWTDIDINVLSMNWKAAIKAYANLPCMEMYRELLPWPNTLLERSGSRPIVVKLRLLFGENTLFCAHCQPMYITLILQLLVPHAPRFKSFTVVADAWEPLRDLSAALFDSRLPMLESWDATLNTSVSLGLLTQSNVPTFSDAAVLQYSLGIDPSYDVGFELYPKLVHLSVRGIIHRWERFSPRSLVTLELSSLPLDSRPSYEALGMIPLNSQETLKELTLSAAAPRHSTKPTSDNTKITLPKLEKLRIGIAFSQTGALLPEFLEVPALRSLDIHDMTRDHPSTTATSQALLRNTSNMVLFYTGILESWPLQQLTHLKLQRPQLPGEPSQTNLGQLYKDFKAGQPPSRTPPLFNTLFLRCQSLKRLHLVDPGMHTLMSLAIPVVPEGEQLGILPCYHLDCLHISTSNLSSLSLFLIVMKRYTETGFSSRLRPRSIPTILLDVPPAWGADLASFASRRVC
ncbi:hypothetical protein EV360DRAFT_86796 [Lentinula raphanica]|nr:hypothetical protein EV360DRAFT_86796 [Lentinula raphanica]